MNALFKLVAQTERLGEGFASLPFRVVKATADVVQASIERQIGHDAPRRRVAGGKVGVTQHTLSRGADARIIVKQAGPLHLLANPTHPHLIISTKARSSKTSRRKALEDYSGHVRPGAVALHTPYGPRYAVHHPGTHGKDTWRHGVDVARPLVSETMAAAVEAEIRKAFP